MSSTRGPLAGDLAARTLERTSTPRFHILGQSHQTWTRIVLSNGRLRALHASRDRRSFQPECVAAGRRSGDRNGFPRGDLATTLVKAIERLDPQTMDASRR